MNEVEKMYENAGVKADRIVCYRGFDNCVDNDFNCHCHNEKPCEDATKIYPPFTAEKQIELIKWLARHNFVVCKNLGGWYTGINPTYDEDFGITCNKRATNLDSFEYTLAGLINYLWQDLTEEEKERIKEILE